MVVALIIGLVTLRLSGHYLAELCHHRRVISFYFLFANMDALGRYSGLSGTPRYSPLFGLTLSSSNGGLTVPDMDLRVGLDF